MSNQEVKRDAGKRRFFLYQDKEIWADILNQADITTERSALLKCILNEDYLDAIDILVRCNATNYLDVFDLVCKVGEKGAKKYEVDNWKQVEPRRYLEALMRHIYSKGIDEEFALPHYAHAIWNLHALEWFKRNEKVASKVK